MDLGFWIPLLAATVVLAAIGAAVASRRGRHLAAQRDVIASLARALGAEGTARGHLCAAAARIVDAQFAALAEPSPDGRGLVVTSAVDADLAGRFIAFDAPAASVAAFRSGRTIHVADVRLAAELRPPLIQHTRARSARFEPVRADGTVVGVLVLGWSRRLDELPRHTGELLGLIAGEAARAIAHDGRVEALVRQARTDALTGMPNRRAWDEMLDREVGRAERSGDPVSVALIDLDHFKAYNDEFGHQAGDDLLRRTGAAWRRQLRAQDGLARYGGEEFALVLPGTPLDAALEVVDRVREATPGGQTASAGVVELEPGEEPEQVVARADRALYQAKGAGRGLTVPA